MGGFSSILWPFFIAKCVIGGFGIANTVSKR